MPIDKILPTFRKIAEDQETPIDFVSYFEENYVGVIRGAGVNQRLEAPKFAPEMWNVGSRVLADLPRSNNACEGFHNALRSSITASHPNIWRLLVALKQELSLSEMKIMQKSRGDRPDKKKYALLTERIKRQVTTLDVVELQSCVEFVKAMAVNLS